MKDTATVIKLLTLTCLFGAMLLGAVEAIDVKTFDFANSLDPYFAAIEANGGSASVTAEGLLISSGQTQAAFVRTTDPLPETYTIESIIENSQQYNFALYDDDWSGQAGDASTYGPHWKVLIGSDNFGPAGKRNNIFYASPASWTPPGSMNWAGAWDGSSWRIPGTAWVSPEMNVGELYRLGIQKTEDEYILYIKTLDGTILTEASVPIDWVNNGRSRDYWALGDVHTDSLYGVNTKIVSATVSVPSESARLSEGNVRHVMLDIVLGNVMDYYKQQLQLNPNQPDVIEAIRRIESGVTVTNVDQFERKIIGTWTLVYKDTDTPILDNMEIELSTDIHDQVSESNDSCLSSGGTVTTMMCCKGISDFPNLCVIGACGCSPSNSKITKVCDCGTGRCFDGKSCVLFPFRDSEDAFHDDYISEGGDEVAV